MKTIILLCCIFVFTVSYFNREQTKYDLNNFIGTWKGTSLCQQKSSPCHDETVVYYITKGSGTDSCVINANKIVNGVEEEMGTLYFSYDKTKDEINSTSYNSLWNFKIKNGKMEGTLYVRSSLYRIIELAPFKKN